MPFAVLLRRAGPEPPSPTLTPVLTPSGRLRLPAHVQVSREVVGRLMADPAFMQKLALEQMITIGTALYYEAQVRAAPRRAALGRVLWAGR